MTKDSLPQLDRIYQDILSRLNDGRPFTSPRAALMGYEHLTRVAGWLIGLALEGALLTLTAVNRSEARQLPPLPVAARKGRGQYETLITPHSFQKWTGPIIQGGELPSGYNEYLATFKAQRPQAAPRKDLYLSDFGLTDEELAAPAPAYLNLLETERARIAALTEAV